jgi:hypothetical protein
VTGNDPSPKYADPKSELYHERRAALISYLDRFDSLPKLLGERGYLSHQSGKWWEGNYRHGGFTHGMTRGFPEPGGRHGDDGLTIGREGMQPIEQFVDMAVAEGKPFFLWYAPFLAPYASQSSKTAAGKVPAARPAVADRPLLRHVRVVRRDLWAVGRYLGAEAGP